MTYRVTVPSDSDFVRIDHFGGDLGSEVVPAFQEALVKIETKGLHKALVVVAAACEAPTDEVVVKFIDDASRELRVRISVALVVRREGQLFAILADVLARSLGVNHQLFTNEKSAKDWLVDQPKSYRLPTLNDELGDLDH